MTPELFERLVEVEEGELPLEAIPYAKFLRLSLVRDGNAVGIRMRFDKSHIGSPVPPRLHGGVTGAVLEFAGMAELMWQARRNGAPPDRLPKPISLTVEYLRAGAPADVFASAGVTRQGRRIASVRATAWQDAEDAPIAAGLMHFLIAG